jgi:hypothetical protein
MRLFGQTLTETVVIVDLAPVTGVVPATRIAGTIGRGAFQTGPVKVHDIAALPLVVAKRAPGERMIAVADPKESAEAHNGVFGTARSFVDHHIVNTPELLAGCVVDIRSIDLARRDQPAASIRRIFDVSHDYLPKCPLLHTSLALQTADERIRVDEVACLSVTRAVVCAGKLGNVRTAASGTAPLRRDNQVTINWLRVPPYQPTSGSTWRDRHDEPVSAYGTVLHR